jgi:hypothetical protein
MTGVHRQIGPSTLEPRIVLSRDAERRDFQAAFNSDIPSASEKPGVLEELQAADKAPKEVCSCRGVSTLLCNQVPQGNIRPISTCPISRQTKTYDSSETDYFRVARDPLGSARIPATVSVNFFAKLQYRSPGIRRSRPTPFRGRISELHDRIALA